MSRRQMLAASTATATLASAIVGSTSVFAQAGQPVVSKWILNLEISFDPKTFDQGLETPAAAPQVGPVYWAGPIYRAGSLGPDGTPKSDAVAIGTHRFFGWLFDPAGAGLIGNHTFDINGRGKLVTNLASDGLTGPISGGTGDFKFVRGEMRADFINRASMAFRLQALVDPGSVGM